VTPSKRSPATLAAVVTGAASGIGRAVACSLAEDGLPVWATDINGAELERLAAEGNTKGWALSPRTMDVSDPQAVAQVLAELDASGDQLGAFVHCAGITWRGSMLDMSLPDYERIVSTNLTGSFICLTAAARLMVRQGTGGSIVAITSVNVMRPLVGQAVYSATKAALDVLVRTLAVEVGSAGVRVNAVAAGGVDTPMNPRDGRDDFAKRLPLGRIGQAQDIADAVRFLVSENAGYVTGASLLVDGGLAQMRPG
jgi:NAD(P)-dependent dehydrogenase (short-subunit alcohol dehydrogenase family)